MDLEEWIARNLNDSRVSNYEKLFVRNVLPHIDSLSLNAISAQHHFIDDRGKSRYCDFVIQEGDDLKVAIEIDGFDKTGTGHGMTRSEFLDWQRRHASLVSQGWRVLRFANTDVTHSSKRCAEHLNLLLRDERSRESHRRSLEKRIHDLENRQQSDRERLKIAEEKAPYVVEPPVFVRQDLRGELKQLKSVLATASQASKLSNKERQRLDDLDQAQLKVQALEKETDFMKTTIWAMTALISLLLILFFLNRSDFDKSAISGSSEADRKTEVRPARPTGEQDASTSNSPESERQVEVQPARPVDSQITPTTSPSRAERQVEIRPARQVDEQVTSAILAGNSCVHPLPWREARTHIGKVAAISGPVARVTYREDVRGSPTFITLGRAFPSSERVNIVIWGTHRNKFIQVLDQDLEGRDVCVFSEIQERDGLPQIELKNRTEIQVQ